VLERLVPRSIKAWIWRTVLDRNTELYVQDLDYLPRVKFEKRNVANSIVALNRRDMLAVLRQREVVVELGVDQGEFSETLMEISRPKILHLVDVWASERYHSGLYERVSETFRQPITEGSVRIHRKLSVHAADDFGAHLIDMVYIDTEHSYQVTRDKLRAYATN